MLIGIPVLRIGIRCRRRLCRGRRHIRCIAVQHIGIHRARVGKGHIVQRPVWQRIVYHAPPYLVLCVKAHLRQVKVIRLARLQRELLLHVPLGRQLRHRRRHFRAGLIELSVVAQPFEIAAGVPPWPFYAGGSGRRERRRPAPYDDLGVLHAAGQEIAPVHIQRDDLQSVLPQLLGVHHLQHRAIAQILLFRLIGLIHAPYLRPMVLHGSAASGGTEAAVVLGRILSPRGVIAGVQDIDALVPYRVPLIVRRRDLPPLLQLSVVAAHRRGPHGVLHAVDLVRLAEDQPLPVQRVPAFSRQVCAPRYEQAVRISIAVPCAGVPRVLGCLFCGLCFPPRPTVQHIGVHRTRIIEPHIGFPLLYVEVVVLIAGFQIELLLILRLRGRRIRWQQHKHHAAQQDAEYSFFH